MIYLLDTCTLSYFFRKDFGVVSHFEKLSPQDLSISSITEMEIEYGLTLNSQKNIKIRPIWEELKNLITVLSFGKKEAFYAGSLRAHLKEKGKPIRAYDLLIGSTAAAHSLILITSNVDEFSHIPNLKIEDWRE